MGARVDYAAIRRFRDNLAKLNREQAAEFTEAAVKELAARLLTKVKKRTPVGQYPARSGKTGGTLRRSWTVGEVIREGDAYSIELINPTKYAVYVEYGHRTSNLKSWVDGRFMLTISMQELQADAPRILENKLKRFLEEVVNAK